MYQRTQVVTVYVQNLPTDTQPRKLITSTTSSAAVIGQQHFQVINVSGYIASWLYLRTLQNETVNIVARHVYIIIHT